MPTGYTAGIIDGKITTFPQFAKQCMKAFGACMHMRDENMDVEYKECVPSNYYSEEISKAKLLLKGAKELSDKSIIANKKKELRRSKLYHTNKIKEVTNSEVKLYDLLKKAKDWQPPTKEHESLKEFMIEQLQKTIDFDCGTKYHEKALKQIDIDLLNINPKVIREELLKEANKDISYNTQRLKEEVDRCNESNKWVTDLINSL